jgi:hypothetical protein
VSKPCWARPRVTAALLALGILGTAPWGVMLLRGQARSRTRHPSTPADSVYAYALRHCERRLAHARTRVARQPGDGAAQLRLAGMELNYVGILALVAYEATRSSGEAEEQHDDYLAWRAGFLRRDPQGGLTRTSEAARTALRSPLDTDAQRQALLLLAAARRGLADYHGEAAALAELARRDPDQADPWLRLAEAYGRARRFARADAAMGRGLRLLYARNLPRREPSRGADRPAPTRRG